MRSTFPPRRTLLLDTRSSERHRGKVYQSLTHKNSDNSGSTVTFRVPDPLNKIFRFTHNNNSVNFIVDNILHLDNATNRAEVRLGTCPEPEPESKNVCTFELENCNCELISGLFNYGK